MRKSTYISCNCRGCRRTGGYRASKQWFKCKVHRRFRKLEREAIQTGSELPDCVSSDYRA